MAVGSAELTFQVHTNDCVRVQAKSGVEDGCASFDLLS